mgnify:FL=1
MTKKSFLDRIQNRARLSEEVAKVWNVAIKVDENDPRWAKVENHPDENIVINNFEAVFGMREQVEPVDEKALLIKKAERELAKAKERLAKLESKRVEIENRDFNGDEQLKEDMLQNNLDRIESQKKRIAHLEGSLKVLKR